MVASMVATACWSPPAHTHLMTAARLSKMKWWKAGFLGAMPCWKPLHKSLRIEVSLDTSMGAAGAASPSAAVTRRMTHFIMWGFSLEASCSKQPKRLVRRGCSMGWMSALVTRGTVPSLTVSILSTQQAAYVWTMQSGLERRMLRMGNTTPYASFGSWLRKVSTNLRRSAMRIGFLETLAAVTVCRSASTCLWKKSMRFTWGLVLSTPLAFVSAFVARAMKR
mmetsp:Transcript_8832/g.20636  ORF Transcript_8832/g.20636 Transcript_8832/m.20636 type:complete len:222 (+) Transcript_8832:1117-1782(+)